MHAIGGQRGARQCIATVGIVQTYHGLAFFHHAQGHGRTVSTEQLLAFELLLEFLVFRNQRAQTGRLTFMRETKTINELFYYGDAIIDAPDSENRTISFNYQYGDHYIRFTFYTHRIFVHRVDIVEK